MIQQDQLLYVVRTTVTEQKKGDRRRVQFVCQLLLMCRLLRRLTIRYIERDQLTPHGQQFTLPSDPIRRVDSTTLLSFVSNLSLSQFTCLTRLSMRTYRLAFTRYAVFLPLHSRYHLKLEGMDILVDV